MSGKRRKREPPGFVVIQDRRTAAPAAARPPAGVPERRSPASVVGTRGGSISVSLPLGDPEAMLRQLPEVVDEMYRQTVRAVLDQHDRVMDRRTGSWAAVGRCLGVSRQSAWERFSRLVS